MKHYEREWTTSDGLKIFGQGWRPDGDPKAVLCLVHGLGEHSGRYQHVAAALAREGFALHGCDLRGHGRSGGARGHTPSFAALLDDVDRLLDDAKALYGDTSRFLYGHSLGGTLVLNYALDLGGAPDPQRVASLAGVISTSPWLRLSMSPSSTTLWVGRLMDRLWPAFAQSNGLDVSALSHDPQVARSYREDPLVHDRISARLGIAMFVAGEQALARASEFAYPLLLMHGGADRLTSPLASEEFAGKVRQDSTFKYWDGFYHETHNEPEKAEVLRFMVDWLKAHLPA